MATSTVAQQRAINIRPIVACVYYGVFIEPLAGNALTCHNIKDMISSIAAYNSALNLDVCMCVHFSVKVTGLSPVRGVLQVSKGVLIG
jgi:hypothetical protein